MKPMLPNTVMNRYTPVSSGLTRSSFGTKWARPTRTR